MDAKTLAISRTASMLIQSQALTPLLKKGFHALYLLLGQDYYLSQKAADEIKKTWRLQEESETSRWDLTSIAHWGSLIESANHYSLFSTQTLLEAHLENKTIEASIKPVLLRYLDNYNPRSLILLRAPHLPAKSIQWLTAHPQVVGVSITPLNSKAFKQWMLSELKKQPILCSPEVSDLIFLHTEGNMLACAQLIEKLSLSFPAGHSLSVGDLEAHLVDESNHPLFELSEAVLGADLTKSLHLLQKAFAERIEPTFILWLLTEEIRKLIQIQQLTQQGMAFQAACTQLKIWPKRMPLYQQTLSRLSPKALYNLLQKAHQLDVQIKSSQTPLIWHQFNQIVQLACY